MKPERGNCVVFALRRWYQQGGYLIVRRSWYGWWPHLIWSADLVTFEEFLPVDPTRRRFPPVWFAGMIRRWTP